MKRTRLICILLAVLLLGALALLIFRNREPRYQGRTLSQWIGKYESNPGNFDQWQISSNAVRQIGPAAIPFLLKWIQVTDSSPKAKLIDWLQAHPSIHFQLKSAYDYHSMAEIGFSMLGSDAKPAWPDLVRFADTLDMPRRIWAIRCLYASRPDKEILLPVLLRLIHDPVKTIQYEAANEFRVNFPLDAAAAGVNKILPATELSPVAPASTTEAQRK